MPKAFTVTCVQEKENDFMFPKCCWLFPAANLTPAFKLSTYFNSLVQISTWRYASSHAYQEIKSPRTDSRENGTHVFSGWVAGGGEDKRPERGFRQSPGFRQMRKPCECWLVRDGERGARQHAGKKLWAWSLARPHTRGAPTQPFTGSPGSQLSAPVHGAAGAASPSAGHTARPGDRGQPAL